MRIILTHIPRTGGTSLFEALKTQEPLAKARDFDSLSELATISDRELNSFNLLSTYVGTKLFERLDDSWQKILVLRDPLERTISSYCFNRKAPDIHAYTKPVTQAISFRDYLASRDPLISLHISNVQTWTVLGDKALAFRRQQSQLSSKEALEQAVQRFSLYQFVGFTEHLDELWHKICNGFNWKHSPLPQLRKSEQFHPLEKASEEDLDFHLGLDRELLQRARSMHL